MSSLSLVSGIEEVNLLLKTFNRPRWLFLCRDNIFPEVIMNMKSQGYKYIYGEKQKELFLMSFKNNDSKIDFILGLRNFTSILEKYNEIFINKIIPRRDILHCIEKNSRLVALSKTSASISIARKLAAESVVTNGFPVPPAKITTRLLFK